MARIVVLVLCALVLLMMVIVGTMGYLMFGRVREMTAFHYRSHTDTFHVTVLEMKAGPGSFMERLRVRCEEDMDAGIWVTDMKQTGLFETSGATGETFYREGQPHKAGQSALFRAADGFSTCDILFTVSATPSNTVWHSRISAGSTNAFGHGEDASGVDTTLPVPMAVNQVQTNWPGSYPRGSALPVASLGDYKILLLIK